MAQGSMTGILDGWDSVGGVFECPFGCVHFTICGSDELFHFGNQMYYSRYSDKIQS